MAAFKGLSGMNVLITGAASGIGRAIALRLGENGCRIAIMDRDAQGASQTARQVRDAGSKARAYAIDIRDTQAVESAVEQAENEIGPLSGLVNNAGWDRAMRFLESERTLWQKIIDINLYGPLNVTRSVLERMNTRGAGRIVSIASDAGRVGSTGESVYAACKGGIIAFSKSLARETARQGITVNIVSPGPTDTPLFADFDPSGKIARALERAIPMGRLARPEDFPGIVAFLLSDDAAFITGQTISVSGGLTMHG